MHAFEYGFRISRSDENAVFEIRNRLWYAPDGHCQVKEPEAFLPGRSSEVTLFQQAQVAVFQSLKARSLRSR